jgi:alkylation response protein AidB-like acyl-CoA dehydrogenase
VDLSLSVEQEMFRKTARDFVDGAVIPHVRDWDRSETMDRGIVKKLAEVGFLGLTVPEEYGGTPCDYLSYSLVMEEQVRRDIVGVASSGSAASLSQLGRRSRSAS